MRPMGHEDDEARLEAYLDGVMPPAEREAFAAKVESSPSLKAEVERQAMIDASLHRCCAAPDPQGVLSRLRPREGAARSTRGAAPRKTAPSFTLRGPWRPLAAAALIGLIAFSGWRTWVSYRGTSATSRYPAKALHLTYQDLLANGFKADWECKTEEQFVSTFKKKLGQPLALGPLPENISVGGLLYVYSISPRAIAVLATVFGEKVLVVVDRAKVDKGQSIPPESGLHLFRREVGGLVLYEVTPLDEPHLLNSFYRPTDRDP